MTGHDDSRRLILVVEDVPGRYATLTPSLESAGYAVRTVGLGSAALAAVAVRQPDAVLVRIGAMERDGIETCRRIRADPANRRMPAIALTDAPPSANARAFDAVAAGIDAGADDFVEPPFAEPLLLAAIRDALRMRRALAEMDAANVAALASAGDIDLDSADPTGPGMAGLARRLAGAAGIEGDELKGAVFGALVHDIGNLGIPDAILSKPGPLTDWERAEMRRHPEIGEGICRSFPSSRAFAPIVRHHHERWDGAGYPDGIAGTDIPLGARVFAVADSLDAMTSDRPYRQALSWSVACDEILAQAGAQFDPDVVAAFRDHECDLQKMQRELSVA
jgi:cyclic di-GMP phosphodiesterase